MTAWTNTCLGEVITLKRGYDLPKRDRREGAVPVVSSSGPSGFHSETKAAPPGVVTGRYGTLGKVYYIDVPYWPLNTTLYVKDFKDNDERFVAYFLESMGLERYDGAAAVPGLDRNVLHRLGVRWPSRNVQEPIAAVLAAYDELIENNLRRIEILQEMAQAVYREWFVDFRFPGHEDVPLVDSPLGLVPDGWSVEKLGDRVELAYGKALKAEDRHGGDVPVYGSSGVVGWHDKPLVDGLGIVVGRKGNVGAVHWVDSGFYPIDTTFYVVSDLPSRYLVCNLQQQHFINSDAAVPGLNRNQAYANPLVVPSEAVLGAFTELVEPIGRLVRNLRDQNENLCSTRDLLLPKLVSGEIDVSELDIETEWLVS